MNKDDEPKLNGFTRAELFELLVADFNEGVLTLKPRDRSHFPSQQAYKMWTTRYAGKVITSQDSAGYIAFTLKGVRLLAHRILWFMRTGEVPCEIDHKDGNPSNNMQGNLRNVTHDKNLENVRLRHNNTTGITGVHFYKSRQKWTAHITKHGKTRCLGYFETKEQAVAARLAAEEEVGFECFR